AARILAEAQAASALNHPHICTVYEAGEAEGRAFIAMEYVHGKPLSELVPASGLPADEVIRYGIQIAQALEHAHEHGIVHRDLKGQNVIVTATGHVKLIDFGIAIPVRPTGGDDVTRAHPVPPASGPVGTLGYMAPEVLRGEPASAASDIWSLGVLLYEAASGSQPFGGPTQSDVVNAITKESPAPLPAKISAGLRGVIQRCLMKEPAQRYRHAAAVEAALEAIQSTASVASQPATAVARSSPAKWLVIAVFALAIAGAAAWTTGLIGPAASPRVLQLANPVRVTGASGQERSPTWSRDGGLIAYAAASPDGGPRDIFVTQIGSGEPVNRTADHPDDDFNPAWSPDGNQIAFTSARDGSPGYYVMPALGGAAQRMFGAFIQGNAQWSADGREIAGIVVENGKPAIEIASIQTRQSRRVPLEPIKANAFNLRWSPDGRFFAFVEAVAGDAEAGQLWILRLGDRTWHPVLDRRFAVWSPEWSSDGRTLYFVSNREGSMDLWQVAVNANAAGLGFGEPARVTNGVGMWDAALSPDGKRLAYTRGNRVSNIFRVPIRNDRPVTWADAEQLTFDEAFIELMSLSLDGTRVYFSSDRSGNQDLWEMPAGGGKMRQLTTDPAPDWGPRLSPSGRDVLFYSYRSGNRDVWIMPAEGGPPRQMTTDASEDFIPVWSADGSQIAFGSVRSGNSDLWIMPAGGGDARQLTRNPGPDGGIPLWSPDGAWIYYGSGRAGRLASWRMPATGTDEQAEPFGDWNAVIGWSADGATTYASGKGVIWSVARDGKGVRRITAGDDDRRRFLGGGKPGTGVIPMSLTTDGRFLYFSWAERVGDIWTMDVVRER
ncbi:MAG TPA: protein kinase, partial [Mycobacterium sp.]|nr:protein kinase [Mycobacterium sp.]